MTAQHSQDIWRGNHVLQDGPGSQGSFEFEQYKFADYTVVLCGADKNIAFFPSDLVSDAKPACGISCRLSLNLFEPTRHDFSSHLLLISLQDQGQEILGGRGSDGGSGGGTGSKLPKIPVLGLYQTQSTAKGGRVVVYGDSNCVDNSHLNSKVGLQSLLFNIFL